MVAGTNGGTKMDAGNNGGTKWLLVTMVVQNGCLYQWWHKMDAGTNSGDNVCFNTTSSLFAATIAE